MSITLQQLNDVPETNLAQLTVALTSDEKARLVNSTIHTYLVRRGGQVICLFGVARESLISDYYGVWFGLTRGVKLSLPELRSINSFLDTLTDYYHMNLRASVDLSQPIHTAFARFCKFIKYGETSGFGSYERKGHL